MTKIIIGRLAAPYGLKGWVKVHSFTEPKTNICAYPQAWLRYPDQETWQPYQASIKASQNAILLKLPDCDDPESAKKLSGVILGVDRAQLPALAADEYYWSDLEGLKVFTAAGVPLGILDHFILTGANDVMLVKDGQQERLIPYIEDVVVKVDLEGQQLIVDWDPEF